MKASSSQYVASDAPQIGTIVITVKRKEHAPIHAVGAALIDAVMELGHGGIITESSVEIIEEETAIDLAHRIRTGRYK